jgi:hypothetical protein
MRVLVACEFSGIVREAFRRRGHDAWSCDLLPTEIPSKYHIQTNVLNILGDGTEWDMMLGFPPCTHLAASGSRWWAAKIADGRQQNAIVFFKALLDAPIEKIALENPVGCLPRFLRKYDQIIQSYQFGHDRKKQTCLWLKNLPLLRPTNIVPLTAEGRRMGNIIHFQYPDPITRMKERSRTFTGIAEAMAEQWGGDNREILA